MSVYERDETYVHWTKIRDEAGQPVAPTTIKISITDPDGTLLVDAQDMTQEEIGLYYYNYQIPADANFGNWDVIVRATDAVGNATKFTDEFYLLPWNILAQIRSQSGIGSRKSISDDDLAQIAWDAYVEVLEDVLTPHSNEGILKTCYNGDDFYRAKDYPIADRNGDGLIDEDDIDVMWKDSNGHFNVGKAEGIQAEIGELEPKQADGSDIPNTQCGIFISYCSYHPTYSEQLFKKAVVYMAAHEVILRFHEIDRATLADIQSNRQIILANPNRMEKKYLKIRNRICKPRCGGVK